MKQELIQISNGVYNIRIENSKELPFLMVYSLEFEKASDANCVTKISANGYDIHSNNFNTETNPIIINAPIPIRSSTNVILEVHGNFSLIEKRKVFASFKTQEDISQTNLKDGVGKYINEDPFNFPVR